MEHTNRRIYVCVDFSFYCINVNPMTFSLEQNTVEYEHTLVFSVLEKKSLD